jgi:hypothetical protein
MSWPGLVDDADAVTRAYGCAPMWDGLALLDEAFVPHYRSPGHPKTAVIELVVARHRAEGRLPHPARRAGPAHQQPGQLDRIAARSGQPACLLGENGARKALPAADPDVRQRSARCAGGVRPCSERKPGPSSKAAKTAGDCVTSASDIDLNHGNL